MPSKGGRKKARAPKRKSAGRSDRKETRKVLRERHYRSKAGQKRNVRRALRRGRTAANRAKRAR